MHSFGLFLFLNMIWCLQIVAGAAKLAVEDARNNVPDDKRRGISFCGILSLLVPALWLIAIVLNSFHFPIGTWLVGGMHVAIGIMATVTLIRDVWRLREVQKHRANETLKK